MYLFTKESIVGLRSKRILNNSVKKYNKNFWRRGKEERRLRNGEAHQSFVARNCFVRSSIRRTATSLRKIDRRYEEQQHQDQQRRYKEQLEVLKDLIRGREQDGDQELPTASTTAVATPNFSCF